MLSKRKKALVCAYKKGYRIKKGIIYNPNNETIKGYYDQDGYHTFGIRFNGNSSCKISVHKLVAYQKYGKLYMENDFLVRHNDKNRKNNKENNISLMTRSQRFYDRPYSEILKSAKNASEHAQKHDHKKIIDLHQQGKSYKDIMKKLGISSKGTISFIIKQSIEASNEKRQR